MVGVINTVHNKVSAQGSNDTDSRNKKEENESNDTLDNYFVHRWTTQLWE